ncbi:MAG: hypothetical protein AABW67_01325 [Nanoarchaeota archaeon]
MKNKNNKNMKKAIGKELGNFNSFKIAVIILFLIILISFVFLVSALTSDERQSLNDELNNLTADLNSQGYSWLVNTFFLQLNDKVYNNQKLLYSNLELT